MAALVSVALAGPAAGQPPPPTRGQALFDEAKELMAASRYGEACPKLEESQRLIVRSITERWPEAASDSTEALFGGALEVGEYTNLGLIAYARRIGANRSICAGPARSGKLTNTVCTPRSASSR